MEPIRCGNRHFIDLWNESPSKEQLAAYAMLIRSLRDMPGECVIFQFTEDPTDLLCFVRMFRSGNRIYVEAMSMGNLYAKSMTVWD